MVVIIIMYRESGFQNHRVNSWIS